MGLYIHDMKMPKDENDFVKLVIFNDGRCFVAVGENEVTSKTGIVTAVELPPHGRLIDADALKNKHHWTDDFYETEYVEVEDIDAAPTIIPAEGGDADAR